MYTLPDNSFILYHEYINYNRLIAKSLKKKKIIYDMNDIVNLLIYF